MNRRLVHAVAFCVFFGLFLAPLTAHAVSLSDLWNTVTSSPGNILAGLLSGLIALFGSIFTGIGYVFISFAGALFDGAIAISVTNFGQLFGSVGFEQAIYLIWQVFRDIGNIVMIFMFIFVAFMIILDNHEYNIKTHVTKIIIVALFINFSLFFTKAAIDVTNYFAFQFYKGIEGIALQNAARVDEASIGNPITSLGGNTFISTYFLSAMGISSFAQYGKLLEQNITDPGNMFATMVGIFIFQMLAAAIFAYGAVLLVMRIIVLMILMATSSLAVVAYIVPATSKYFTQWREALIKNAVFGPLLLIMLWAAAHLSQAVIAIPNSRQALGNAISSPKDALGIMTLLSYLIVCGFLFAAIKIASSLSAQSDKYLGPLGKLATSMRGAPAGMFAGILDNLSKRRRDSNASAYAQQKFDAERALKTAKESGSYDDYKKAQDNLDQIKKRIETGASSSALNKSLDAILKGTKGVAKLSGLPVAKSADANLNKDVKKIEEDQKKLAEKIEADARVAASQESKKKSSAEFEKLTRQNADLASAISKNTDALGDAGNTIKKETSNMHRDSGRISELQQTILTKREAGQSADDDLTELDKLKRDVGVQQKRIEEAKKQIDGNSDLAKLIDQKMSAQVAINKAQEETYKAMENKIVEKEVRASNEQVVKQVLSKLDKKTQSEAESPAVIEETLRRLSLKPEQLKREVKDARREAYESAMVKRSEEKEEKKEEKPHAETTKGGEEKPH